MTNAYNILVRKPPEKRQIGRARRRWRIILKCILKKLGVVWIKRAHDTVQWKALLNSVMGRKERLGIF